MKYMYRLQREEKRRKESSPFAILAVREVAAALELATPDPADVVGFTCLVSIIIKSLYV